MAAIRGASLERLFRGAFLTRRSANHLGLLNVSIAQPARTLVAYRAGAISRASWEQPRSRVSPLLTSALQSYRSNSTISASTASSGISAESIAHEHEEHEAKTDPSVSRKIVGWWYLISGSLVFGIVVLGGLTRLTESGLSITEWNVIKGMKPPTSEADWNEEFDKYKSSPEYKL